MYLAAVYLKVWVEYWPALHETWREVLGKKKSIRHKYTNLRKVIMNIINTVHR